jgi:AbrB family looped-hinge helix DNA binding protein
MSSNKEGGMAVREVEVQLRKKNQLTLPEPIAERLGVAPGDRLVFEADDEHRDGVRLRRLRRSYAGALAGVYGRPEEVATYLRGERASWDK